MGIESKKLYQYSLTVYDFNTILMTSNELGFGGIAFCQNGTVLKKISRYR